MKTKFKRWWYRVWLEPNPEGVRGKDATLIFCFGIVMFVGLSNLALWISKPEQAWIGDIIFFAK